MHNLYIPLTTYSISCNIRRINNEVNNMVKTIKVNKKRYGLLQDGLTYFEAKDLAKEWRTLGGTFGKRLAVCRDYKGMTAVFVRPLAYVD